MWTKNVIILKNDFWSSTEQLLKNDTTSKGINPVRKVNVTQNEGVVHQTGCLGTEAGATDKPNLTLSEANPTPLDQNLSMTLFRLTQAISDSLGNNWLARPDI